MRRRPLTLLALAALIGLAAALAAGAASGGERPSASTAVARKAPPLTRFASCRGFLAHVRARAPVVTARRAAPPVAVLAPGAEGDRAAVTAPQAGVDFSGTNVQEAGVDEPDLVKTDGRTVFGIAGGRVQVVDVTGPAPRRLAALELDNLSPSGLLLIGDRLIVIGDSGAPVPVGGPVAIDAVAPFAPGRTVLAQVDVADPGRPRVIARMAVDGHLVAARRTGGTVRAVVASTPEPIALGRPRALRAGAGAWLPRLTVRDVARRRTARRAAVGCRAVSRPATFSGLGMVTVLTVAAAEPLTLLDSDAILTDGEVVYASQAAMYVATARWADPALARAAEPPRGATLIHKLDTTAPARTTYRASGAVPGYLLNQFSLSEHEGHLRAASTEEPDWWSGADRESESAVTVLAEREGRLVTTGRAGGLGRGERIYAVRFLGDRGYVVTFRQTDPLYALDLSDPARPAVRGELKIPGFSSYLHPVDDATLIGIGQAATGEGRTLGTQVSLFDVSDLAAPRRIARRELDSDWSEAESDHHAVLYWPATRLLALPVQSYGATQASSFAGAVGLHVARDTGVTPIARVQHPGSAIVRRSLVVGGALYTVSEAGILASDLGTLAPRGFAAFG